MIYFTVAWAVFCTYATNICRCNSNSITMYGNTEVTPAVYGLRGNFIFYQWPHFGKPNDYDEL